VFLFLALPAVGLLPARAQAHRLNVDLYALPNQRFQVEGWFSTSEPARGARVRVYQGDNQLLAEGKLDAEGIFQFSLDKATSLRIALLAGTDHPAERNWSAEEVQRLLTAAGGTSTEAGRQESEPAHPVPLSERSSGITIKDVLLGIGFVLALAAFVLSMRNARRLRELQKPRP
jgi:hypothetical protein